MMGEAGDLKGLRDPPQALSFKEARAFLLAPRHRVYGLDASVPRRDPKGVIL
jgi:hypothetical protein